VDRIGSFVGLLTIEQAAGRVADSLSSSLVSQSPSRVAMAQHWMIVAAGSLVSENKNMLY
jgi:hypothetical protein